MQIHELNNFSGTLGSGAYLAVDDGNDTGKISSQGLLAATEARIDNIIAGPAPSAEEIVDARLGADGVTYPSLGDAIRDQFTDVKSAFDAVNNQIAYINGSLISPPYEIGCRYVSSGNEMYNDNPTRITFKRGHYLNLKQGDVMSVDSSFAQTYLGGYSTDGGSSFTGFSGGATEEYIAPVNGKYFFCLVKKNEANVTAEDLSRANEGEYAKFTRDGSMLYYEAPLQTPEFGWIRYSNGEKVESNATHLYMFNGLLPKKIKAFLTSDTNALCAIAFYSTDTISTDGYMQAKSVDFKSGTHNDGLWYETEVPSGCKTVAITTKVPSASVASPIILFDSTSASEIYAKQLADSLEYNEMPLGIGYLNGWIRHGTGAFNESPATKCYVYKNDGFKKIAVFTTSDTAVIDAIAFYSGDSISEDDYLQSSVAWDGYISTGKWYYADVPSEAKTIAVSVRNSETYSPIIKISTVDVLKVTPSLYPSHKQTQTSINEAIHNDISVMGGWKYIYHYGMDAVADRSVMPDIPSQSVFDVRNAHNLGYKCIEVNVHKTSDGKYVATHGQSGALGHDFDTLNGEDAYGTSISQNTLADLQENYRYRSSNPDYRVPITTLEEFLHEAKQFNMVVMAQYVDETELSIVKSIMGNRFFLYQAPRTVYGGAILRYESLTSKDNILYLCDSYGYPFIYSMGNPSSFSDETLQDIINTLHQNNYYIATAYQSGANLEKYSRMGFDFFAVGENYFENEVVLDGKKLVFNQDGTVSWVVAEV